MSTRIRDEDFRTPGFLNSLPCVASDRYLQKVDEQVKIIRVCQDPNNISVVIIDYSLIGAFKFVPKCYILSVDGDRIYEQNQIQAPLYANHPKCDDVPILTNCQVHHGQVVFDFGSVIPNYVTATNIEFELVMVGTVPEAFGVSFPNQSPSDIYEWEKGILPNPIGIKYQGNTLSVLFDYRGGVNCSCDIQCIIPSGIDYNIEFCPDETQEIVIKEGSLSGSPESILIRLRDSLGNQSTLDTQTFLYTKVESPSVIHFTDNFRNEIRISYRAEDLTALKNAQYQILRYEGTETNYKILKDWSHRDWDYFTDYDIAEYKTYGYAVRYRDEFGIISLLSLWSVVNT